MMICIDFLEKRSRSWQIVFTDYLLTLDIALYHVKKRIFTLLRLYGLTRLISETKFPPSTSNKISMTYARLTDINISLLLSEKTRICMALPKL